jgi:hypothetical protein
MFGIAARQALAIARLDAKYRRLFLDYCRLARELAGMRDELRKVRADAECLALMVPDRQTALALVRDRRRIDRLDEVGE